MPSPSNVTAALAQIDALLEAGAWAVEAVSFRSGNLVAVKIRRLQPAERAGAPPVTTTNDRGMVVTTYFPRDGT